LFPAGLMFGLVFGVEGAVDEVAILKDKNQVQ
jgi:hypothetical protein